jgi:hypothetical protein
MANWEKLLWRMEADTDPRGFTYEDAARVLRGIGFPDPPKRGGSHRAWRLELANGIVARVGLVQKGHGTLKPGYIRDMVKELREKGLIPPQTEDKKDDVDDGAKDQKSAAPPVDGHL